MLSGRFANQQNQAGAPTVNHSSKSISKEGDVLKERINARIRPDLERIETQLEQCLSSAVPLISLVARYIIRSGGKRLRPLLMILAARLCGYEGTEDAVLSVVFEFIHAASLLHDDVVDHAEVRRNKPAANTIWGNPAVVLVGDYLYSKSFLMAIAHNDIRILDVLSETTTLMAEGEVLQLIHSDDMEITEAEYIEVITRKTAVLISAACRIGAIFGKGTPEQVESLRAYGYHMGVAFQLADDALDYTGSVEELGKPVGNDIQEGKATLPLICALRNGTPEDRIRLREIFSADTIEAADFAAVKEIVSHSGGLDYTVALALEHVRRAREALQGFTSGPALDTLLDMADYVVCRRS